MRHGLEVREVEAQPLVGVERAGLADVGAEHLAKRPMKEVRRGMVALDGPAADEVDGELGRGARGREGRPRGDPVQVAARLVLDRVEDREGLPADQGVARVAHLAAHLGVEGGLVEDEEHALSGGDDLEQFRGRALVGVDRVAGEEGGSVRRRAAALSRRDDDLLLLGRAAPLPLLLHQGLEALRVDGDPPLGGDHLSQVQRKPVGVVELEHGLAWEGPGRGRLVEALQAALERPAEALLLGSDHPAQGRLLAPELREDIPQGGDNRLDQFLEEARLEPQVPAVEGGAAQDPADDVVATLVSGKDPVGDGA